MRVKQQDYILANDAHDRLSNVIYKVERGIVNAFDLHYMLERIHTDMMPLFVTPLQDEDTECNRCGFTDCACLGDLR